jgi:alginate O-acetyltransferase complex protein AlgI
MFFDSTAFLFVYLPVTICIYYLIGRFQGGRTQMAFLALASLVFCGWWSLDLLVILICSTIGNFGSALFIHGSRGTARSRASLAMGIGANLALLGYFKYAGFFVQVINDLTHSGVPAPEIMLPLAISIITVQQIAYLVDVHTHHPAERNLLTYSLFVMFFPQMVAGPIVRHVHMIPQYKGSSRKRFDLDQFGLGITIFTLGLFKKVWLADTAEKIARPVFDEVAITHSVSFFEAWFGSLAYSFQIYFEFSGYADMAIGLGLMFGICLPIGFLSPYKATSIIDFWQRWNMTLSRFLRDYLYIPLGGNRVGTPRRYINILATMIIGGLWFGAGWTFIVWGILHGILLCLNHFWRWLRPEPRKVTIVNITLARLLTFLAVTITWVFFRAEDLPTSLSMLCAMSGFGDISFPLILRPYFGSFAGTLEGLGIAFSGMAPNGLLKDPTAMLTSLTVMAVIIWWTPSTAHLLRSRDQNLPSLVKDEPGRTINWRPSIAWGLATGMILAVCFLGLSRISSPPLAGSLNQVQTMDSAEPSPIDFTYFNF